MHYAICTNSPLYRAEEGLPEVGNYFPPPGGAPQVFLPFPAGLCYYECIYPRERSGIYGTQDRPAQLGDPPADGGGRGAVSGHLSQLLPGLQVAGRGVPRPLPGKAPHRAAGGHPDPDDGSFRGRRADRHHEAHPVLHEHLRRDAACLRPDGAGGTPDAQAEGRGVGDGAVFRGLRPAQRRASHAAAALPHRLLPADGLRLRREAIRVSPAHGGAAPPGCGGAGAPAADAAGGL